MAPKKQKKINKPKKSHDDSESAGESPVMVWLIAAAKAWCNAPAARSERTARKKKLGEIMQVETQSVKNFYNQGQIKSKHVFPVLETVTGVPQEELVFIFENYSYFKGKLNELPPEKRRLYSLISLLSDNEVFILNRLLEAGLEANKAIQAESNED
jgi:hypothetical protein